LELVGESSGRPRGRCCAPVIEYGIRASLAASFSQTCLVGRLCGCVADANLTVSTGSPDPRGAMSGARPRAAHRIARPPIVPLRQDCRICGSGGPAAAIAAQKE
jgi:hypothetical protein